MNKLMKMKDNPLYSDEDVVLAAIDILTARKNRPNLARIFRILHKIFNFSFSTVEKVLQNMLSDGRVLKVTYKGNISYRNSATWKRYNFEVKKIINNYDMPNNDLGAAFASAFINNSEYIEIGVPKETVINYLKTMELSREYNDIDATKLVENNIMMQKIVVNNNKLLFQSTIDLKNCDLKSEEKLDDSDVSVCDEENDLENDEELDGDSKELKDESQTSENESSQNTNQIDLDSNDNDIIFPDEETKESNFDETNSIEETNTTIEKTNDTIEENNTTIDESNVTIDHSSKPTTDDEEYEPKKVKKKPKPVEKPQQLIFDRPRRREMCKKILPEDFYFPTLFKRKNYRSSKSDAVTPAKKAKPTFKFGKCLICKEEGEISGPDQMVKCESCVKRAHSVCAQDDMAEEGIDSDENEWNCLACRAKQEKCQDVIEIKEDPVVDCCSICELPSDKTLGDIFNCCDCKSSFHRQCHRPVVLNKPPPDWMCFKCQITKSYATEPRRPRRVARKIKFEREQRLKKEKEREREKELIEKNKEREMELQMEVIKHEMDDIKKPRIVTGIPVVTNRPFPDNDVPDISNWDSFTVFNHFIQFFPKEIAKGFLDQDIDGYALSLMSRNDVILGLGFELDVALKVLFHVRSLQLRTIDRKVIWNHNLKVPPGLNEENIQEENGETIQEQNEAIISLI